MKERSSSNMFLEIHSRLLEIPIKVRNAICQECNFSIPTAYRKMRTPDKIDESDRLIPALSNAERQAIIRIVDKELKLLWQDFEKYRQKEE